MSTIQESGDALPANQPDDDSFHKTVEFKATDADEQTAYGAVLVPNKVDHQGDFERPETIKSLAEGFDDRVAERDAVPGVMHAVFPEDDIELVENRVLEEAEALGEKALPPGTWVQGYQFKSDRLWQMVQDGVLSGYSIGGSVKSRAMFEPGAHPEKVTFPQEVKDQLSEEGMVPNEVPIWEIKEARILEVSTVDKPAVPDATHEEYKSLAKADPALTNNVVDARRVLERRGHSEEDAKRLAEYLNDVKAAESAERGLVARAKAMLPWGSDDPSGGKGQSTGVGRDTDAEKNGRTLSQENVESARAVHDAALDMLDRSDVQHGRTRFSDDANADFSLADYGSESKSDELAESSTGPADTVFEHMDKDELKTMIGEVVEEKLDDQDEQTTDEEKSEDATDDLDEIKAMLEDLQSDDEDGEEKASEESNEDLDEIKAMLGTMLEAQGASQQAETGSEKDAWDDSPFAVGGN